MKIGILSKSEAIYSTKSIVEAGIRRGHDMHVIHSRHCYMDITTRNPSVYYMGEKLDGFDAIIPRIASSNTFFGSAVVRQFEMMGVFSVNSSVAISRSRDKLRSLQLLSRKGVGLPITGFSNRPDDSNNLIKLVGGPPLIIKLLEGTQGVGVVLAESKKAAESVIEAFRGLRANILVQEFIEEAGASDVRCFVVGDKVVAAMIRTGQDGDFRSNLHRGGVAQVVKITPEERATAVRASNVMGLHVAGVDLLRSKRGPLVMEVNSSPGLEGIEKATGKDVAGMIIEFIEKKLQSGKVSSREGGL